MQTHCCTSGTSVKASAHHEENTHFWCTSEDLQVNYGMEKAARERIKSGTGAGIGMPIKVRKNITHTKWDRPILQISDFPVPSGESALCR